MENEKYNINIAPGVSNVEVVIREGYAAEIVKAKSVSVSGNINAVYDFLKTRAELLDKTKTLIVYDESNGVLILESDSHFPDSQIKITAKIEDFEDLKAFGINKEKFFSLKELEKFIRMNRFWFADKDAHFTLTGQLKAFSAKVQSELQAEADQRGNKNNMFKKQVTSDLAADFVLNIPIFKGCDNNVFRVEICYDVTDSAVRFWLESVELLELQKTALNESFAKQIEEIKNMGFTLITK